MAAAPLEARAYHSCNEFETPNCRLFNPKPYQGQERPERQIE